ncbi:MAG TPA: 1,2-phenylacetyl-CoA epoxidase subunit PaaD [Steroidobacteraceae bacterium]
MQAEADAAPLAVAPAGSDPRLHAILDTVLDPEIPALSVTDLGIVRFARQTASGQVQVGVSPTYSGCPATQIIKSSIAAALHLAGFSDVAVIEVLAPPWTSDWITANGRRKLRAYGIAPPAESVATPRRLLQTALDVACPRCASTATDRLSEFGSTPCKALYRCTNCLEPFDYFKCI